MLVFGATPCLCAMMFHSSQSFLTSGPVNRRGVLNLAWSVAGCLFADFLQTPTIAAAPPNFYMSSSQDTQTSTFMKFDADGNLKDVVRAKLNTRIVVPPTDTSSCSAADDGDLLSIRYAAAYEVLGQNAGSDADEPSIDLLTKPKSSPRWKVYDSSSRRSGAVPFRLPLGDNNVIPGVDIALHGMCQGEWRVVYIPAGLAYGGKGSKLFGVPPNARIRYDVQLLDITSMPRRGTAQNTEWRVTGQIVE